MKPGMAGADGPGSRALKDLPSSSLNTRRRPYLLLGRIDLVQRLSVDGQQHDRPNSTPPRISYIPWLAPTSCASRREDRKRCTAAAAAAAGTQQSSLLYSGWLERRTAVPSGSGVDRLLRVSGSRRVISGFWEPPRPVGRPSRLSVVVVAAGLVWRGLFVARIGRHPRPSWFRRRGGQEA